MEFEYYYGIEGEQFSFVRIPKILLKADAFSSVSIGAKLLYGLFVDRMGMASTENWYDEHNRVFIIFPLSDIQEELNVSKKTAIGLISELENVNLVEKRQIHGGKPNRFYLKDFLSVYHGKKNS